MKKLFAITSAAILFASSALGSTVQLNVTVPGSGTPFDFDSDGTNNWPLVRLWDGTTKMTVNANGQASAANSTPVTLPITQYSADPCTMHGDIIGTATKSSVAISTTAGTTQLVGPLSLNQVYICSIFIQPSAAATVSIVGGLGGACTTGTPAAIAGSTTLANGIALTTSNGFIAGNGGATVMSTTTSGHGVCLEQVGTAQLSGYMTYVQTQF